MYVSVGSWRKLKRPVASVVSLYDPLGDAAVTDAPATGFFVAGSTSWPRREPVVPPTAYDGVGATRAASKPNKAKKDAKERDLLKIREPSEKLRNMSKPLFI